MRAITATVGPLASASANSIATTQSLLAAGSLTLNGTLVSGGVATIAAPSQVTVTSGGDDRTLTWTVTGTNWAGNTISESFSGGNGVAATSSLTYATVTKIAGSKATASTVTAGNTQAGSSPWIRFDEWAYPELAIQTEVTGTVSYTFESSFDDPNTLISTVTPDAMVWDSTISPLVSATTSQIASVLAAPLWGRISLASGSGSVKAVFTQYHQADT